MATPFWGVVVCVDVGEWWRSLELPREIGSRLEMMLTKVEPPGYVVVEEAMGAISMVVDFFGTVDGGVV